MYQAALLNKGLLVIFLDRCLHKCAESAKTSIHLHHGCLTNCACFSGLRQRRVQRPEGVGVLHGRDAPVGRRPAAAAPVLAQREQAETSQSGESGGKPFLVSMLTTPFKYRDHCSVV